MQRGVWVVKNGKQCRGCIHVNETFTDPLVRKNFERRHAVDAAAMRVYGTNAKPRTCAGEFEERQF